MKKSFKAVVAEGKNGAAHIALPFDPDEVWGKQPRHRLSGTIDGQKSALHPGSRRSGPEAHAQCGGATAASRSARKSAWCCGRRDRSKSDLAPDFLAALKAEPKALAFFTDLAQFYRKAYLRWIDATKKKPDERVRRIRETVKLLEGRREGTARDNPRRHTLFARNASNGAVVVSTW